MPAFNCRIIKGGAGLSMHLSRFNQGSEGLPIFPCRINNAGEGWPISACKINKEGESLPKLYCTINRLYANKLFVPHTLGTLTHCIQVANSTPHVRP